MENEPRRATPRESWLYSLTALSSALTVDVANTYLVFYYVDVKHLPPSLAAIIMTAFGIYTAVNDPILGALSDRRRHPRGRRIPMIRWLALPFALVFALMWRAPFDGITQPYALLAYMALMLLIYEGLATLITVARLALLPEMFPEFTERTQVSGRMTGINVLGLLAGVALAPQIAASLGWGSIGLIFGGIALVTLLLGAQGMFERALPPGQGASLGQTLRNTLRNQHFMLLTMAFTAANLTMNALTVGLAFYMKYSLILDETASSLAFLAIFGAALPGLLFWRWLALRSGARAAIMLSMGGTALSLAALGLAPTLLLALISGGLMGLSFSGAVLLNNVMLADVIDEDELHSGERREGSYIGVSWFVQNASIALAALIFGLIAGAFGYDPALAVQPESAGLGFRLFISGPGIIGALLGVLALSYYPLHGDRLVQMRAALDAKRAQ